MLLDKRKREVLVTNFFKWYSYRQVAICGKSQETELITSSKSNTLYFKGCVVFNFRVHTLPRLYLECRYWCACSENCIKNFIAKKVIFTCKDFWDIKKRKFKIFLTKLCTKDCIILWEFEVALKVWKVVMIT